MADLSPTMLVYLKKIGNAHGYSPSVPFATGEALRRRGLAGRYTEHVTYVERATDDVHTGRWPTRKSPMVRHDWHFTQAGRAALQEAGR